MKKQGTIAVVSIVMIAGVIGGIVTAKSIADTRAHDSERDAAVQAVVERVAASDPVVIAVDEAVSAEMTTSTPEEVAVLKDRIGPAVEELGSVAEEIERIEGTYKRLDDTPLAAVSESVSGRLEMLEVGERILALDMDTATAIALLNEGWEAMMEAHEQGNAAVAAANLHTTKGLVESAFQNNAALTSLETAKERFTEANGIIPSLRIDEVIDYLDKKLEANRLARKTDSALAKNDVEGANKLVDPYNKAEAAAAQAASALVHSPKELIKEEYDALVTGLLEEYQTVRSTTAGSDAAVRTAPENGEND